jgi:hypothetical protein
VGDRDGEIVAVCKRVETLWYEIVKVIAGEVGVGVMVVEQHVDGSEVAESVIVYEIAMVGSCVVATTDAVGVKESAGGNVCDLMLLQYIDVVGVCVGILDGVDLSVVVGENVGLPYRESVVVSLCEEAEAVNA